MAFVKNDVGLNNKMKVYRAILLTLCVLSAAMAEGQTDSTRRDIPPGPAKPQVRSFRAQRAVLFRFNYTLCIPGGDLSRRFGAFSNLGGGVGLKLENGWDIRAEGSFLFSRNVYEFSMLDSLRDHEGYIIDQNGNQYNPNMTMRGYTVSAHIGRLFPIDRNQNSGIFISIGGGYIQHKIHFQNVSGFAPQLQGDYLKGYDRLTNGYMINEFIGYQFMSIKKMVNFYLGFEFMQATTQYARNWNYDLRAGDTHTRNDNYWGIRFGWILPIYGANKGEEEFIFR